MSKAMGFGCHRRGHRPAPGFDHPPQVTSEGRYFIPRVCNDCRCMYVEYILGVVAGKVLDASGAAPLIEKKDVT